MQLLSTTSRYIAPYVQKSQRVFVNACWSSMHGRSFILCFIACEQERMFTGPDLAWSWGSAGAYLQQQAVGQAHSQC